VKGLWEGSKQKMEREEQKPSDAPPRWRRRRSGGKKKVRGEGGVG